MTRRINVSNHAAPMCTCTGPPLALEALNGFAVALDVDGNGWSDRYRLLAHGNTPVLKQVGVLSHSTGCVLHAAC
jgi:hypothetical protein